MLSPPSETAATVRILRRQRVRRTITVTITARRPSLLDPRLRGDPWILPRSGGGFALYFDAWEMSALAGSPLDLPSLNTLLHRMRHRNPRRRRRVAASA
ncbi:MAG: hypothetical protein L0Z62_07795 [Gemmataceae bacterium]|nr:hypothetical protein [Gemmataceae bacterium]